MQFFICSCNQRRKVRCRIKAEYRPFGCRQYYHRSYDWIGNICIADTSIEILRKHRFVPHNLDTLWHHIAAWFVNFAYISIDWNTTDVIIVIFINNYCSMKFSKFPWKQVLCVLLNWEQLVSFEIEISCLWLGNGYTHEITLFRFFSSEIWCRICVSFWDFC